jgi:hypothetical protein
MRSKGIFERERLPADRNLWLEPTKKRAVRGTAPPATAKRRLTRRARVFLTLLAILMVVAAGAVAIASGLVPLNAASIDQALAIETVSIEGNRRAPAAELVAATGLEAGMPLHEIDVAGVRTSVEAHPWVQRARVVRVPPSLVIVSVVEREPLAVAAQDGGMPWLVDATGLPFAPAEPDDVASLPWIVAPQPVVDRVPTAELARGAGLALALRGSDLGLGAEIRVAAPPDPEALSLLVAGIPGRVLLSHDGLADQLRRLERLRAAGLPETGAASVIDLRFADRAVLRSAAPPPEAAQTTMGAPSGGAPPAPDRRS